jgi:hypothetical protein
MSVRRIIAATSICLAGLVVGAGSAQAWLYPTLAAYDGSSYKGSGKGDWNRSGTGTAGTHQRYDADGKSYGIYTQVNTYDFYSFAGQPAAYDLTSEKQTDRWIRKTWDGSKYLLVDPYLHPLGTSVRGVIKTCQDVPWAFDHCSGLAIQTYAY